MKINKTRNKISIDMDLSECALEYAILQMPQIFIGKDIPELVRHSLYSIYAPGL